MGLRTFATVCENPLGIIVLQFAGCLLGGSVVGLMVTPLSKRTYATHSTSSVCCSQSPCPQAGHCWPVPQQETLKLNGRSSSVSCGVSGSCCAQCFLWALRASLAGMGFDWKCDFTPPTVLLGLLLCLGYRLSFSGGSNILSWLFSSGLQFWNSRRRGFTQSFSTIFSQVYFDPCFV